jgi:hypothetical protein
LLELNNFVGPDDETGQKAQALSRSTYGVGPNDHWSFDSYIATILANGLVQLAKDAHGRPMHYANHEEWIKDLICVANDFYFIAGRDQWHHQVFLDIEWSDDERDFEEHINNPSADQLEYDRRCMEIDVEIERRAHVALGWIKEHFFELWD